MTNLNFSIAVNKFFYYSMNYPSKNITYPTLFRGEVTESIPSFFEAFEPNMIEHLLGKFKHFQESYGRMGAMNGFYGELDGKLRFQLLSWVNENYDLKETFGLSY